MTWTVEDIPDQRGRVAVVTGASSGLGLHTTRELARRGATVVMATRDQDRARHAREELRAEIPDATLPLVELDLASLASVRACAAAVRTDHDRLDLLVNNAGIMAVPYALTADGFERQLGVNHLGHFVLTRRLLPALLAAPAARVVVVTSFGRLLGRPLDPEDTGLHDPDGYEPWRAYGRSKLANLHFAVGLQRRLAAAGASARSLAAHPGLAHTDLQARSVRATEGGITQRFFHAAARTVGTPARRGAWSQLRAATDPTARGGTLYAPRWITFGPPVRRPLTPAAHSRRAVHRLWIVSERETGESFDVAAIVRDVE